MWAMQRRTFLASVAAGALAPRASHAAQAGISIFLNEPIGTISPLLHGHFLEHLGGVIYDGVWVGVESKIPNTGGIRKALIDAMKRLGSTVVRYPGGCFADSYDWRDGVGPRNTRPHKNNFWANSGILRNLPDNHVSRSDPNSFGTNEFLRFCKEIGSEPYLAANVRSLPAKEFYDWVEYCNAPRGAGTLAERRAAWGDPEPWNVRYWGVGNESWGCGGNLTPEEYSVEFRKFTSWTPNYGKALSMIAAGPNGADYNWTRGFFQQMARKSPRSLNGVWGWALHYYCGTSGKGDSLDFTVENYYDLLERADRMESIVRQHWDAMGEVDRERHVKLVVDEWGAWHRDTTAVAPHHLFGSVQTMRDALIAGLTLDTFHRHADKIAMANVAQLVNCIQTLFLADGDRFCVTPTYHVFDMYKDHHGAEAVRTEFAAPRIDYTLEGKGRSLARLAGAASKSAGAVTLTAVNLSHNEPLETSIALTGAAVKGARAAVLAGPSIQAHNSFASPEAVKPAELAVRTSGGELRLTMPAASVVKVRVEV